MGGGVVDRCRQLNLDVTEVNFGGRATQPGYANLRAQMWGNLREAIKEGVRLPDDADLISDLTGVEYGFTNSNLIQLEKKEDMKKRGLKSPDLADALALCFVWPVFPSRMGWHNSMSDQQAQSDYNPYA